MIFDTAFLVDLMHNDILALDELDAVSMSGETQFVTALTVFELHSGIQRSRKSEAERRKVDNVLKRMLVIPLDTRSAVEAGEIYGPGWSGQGRK